MRKAGDKTDGQRPNVKRSENMLTNRLPPQELEAEAALLGSMILDPRMIGDVIAKIGKPDDLYKPSHAAIYEVIVDCWNHNPDLDLVKLQKALRDKQMLDQIGGVEYLIELAESVPTAASAVYYAGMVMDASHKREIMYAGAKMIELAHSGDTAEELVDQAESMVFEIGQRQQDSGEDADQTFADMLQEAYDDLAETADKRGIMTGFYELDEMTNGLQPGELIILAARPSMGKTAMCLNIASNIAVVERKPCALFSMEMSRKQLATRMMCSHARADSHRVRCNRITQDEYGQLALTVGEMSEAPLFISDKPGMTLMDVRARSRRIASRYGLKAIIIDYLQLMIGPKSNSRQEEVAALSRGLKQLAREMNVPVVCLSQLNRQVESRTNNKPRMSDLRESGAIEQDADVIAMLHREDYYHRGEEGYEETNIAEVIIEKQRNGPTGIVKLKWNAASTRFDNLTADEEQATRPPVTTTGLYE
ncbi:MAG: replicative DNA helicase [SAR86 cluster bacterium]|uniref:Replicative DNA helicase n=1 Tax=SAR86 cluster bacterium TaxID=2030880 RepID=A0A2A5AGC1_9GAMM|nr:MAG: replicative DNA helicase [SAR86 cluster bacterium]